PGGKTAGSPSAAPAPGGSTLQTSGPPLRSPGRPAPSSQYTRSPWRTGSKSRCPRRSATWKTTGGLPAPAPASVPSRRPLSQAQLVQRPAGDAEAQVLVGLVGDAAAPGRPGEEADLH